MKQECATTDAELMLDALEEAQRILSAFDDSRDRIRDDVLAMLQFIICDPTIKEAVRRQRRRSWLKLVV
jgi:hypothetical protein